MNSIIRKRFLSFLTNKLNHKPIVTKIKSFYQKPIVIKLGKIMVSDIAINIAIGSLIEEDGESTFKDKEFTLAKVNIGAIIEEFIFRYPLVSKYAASSFPYLSLMSIISVVEHDVSENNYNEKIKIYNSRYKDYLLNIHDMCIVGAIPHLFLRNTFFSKLTYPLLIGSTSVAFGLTHLCNYNEANNYAIKMVTFCQFSTGLILTCVGLKYGLRYSILYHSAFNTTLIGLRNTAILFENYKETNE